MIYLVEILKILSKTYFELSALINSTLSEQHNSCPFGHS